MMQHKTAYMDVLTFCLLFFFPRYFKAEVSLSFCKGYIKK